MTTRRTRLSIEPLEDRTNPATGTALTRQVFANGLMMQELAKDMSAAGPALRSFLTQVHNTATQAQRDPSQPSNVSALARLQASVARFVASRIGLTLVAPAVTPAPTPNPNPNPTPGAISATRSTYVADPASVAVGSTSTITLTARDANGTPLTTGGANVAFTLGTGTGQGTLSAVTDLGNGRYRATFTATGAGTRTINATIGGTAVATTAPTITVTAAPTTTPSLSLSTVAANPASVPVNGTSQVTLQAKNASGANLTTGGAAVLFQLGSATGGQGNFSQVTDNQNGTYTATFTPTTPGDNTIRATIGGQPVTSTPAPITITAATTGGTPSAATSTVAATSTSVPVNGTSQVTLTARNASGAALTTGGAQVTFGLANTTGGQGDFGTVTDNQNGTYTATFTGETVGPNTITATVNGTAVTTTTPQITVTAAGGGGTPSAAQSTVVPNPTSVPVGGTSQVTLTARNASGTALTTGGAEVTFALGSTTGGQGDFGEVTDNGNGTYTATFTGETAGANTITATIDGQTVTAAPTITVTAASTADPTDSTVAISSPTVPSGTNAIVTLTARDSTGAPLTAGGDDVVFALGSPIGGQGSFGPVNDVGNGTYTATFTAGTTVGANTITATLNDQTVTSTASFTVT